MRRDIDRVLLSRQQIADRVQEMAAEITSDHLRLELAEPAGLTIVPILTGAMIFCSDLIRHIPIAIRIGLMGISSYPGRSIASQGASVVANQVGNVQGQHVLLVDDILDSGNTIRLVRSVLREQAPLSLKTCVLLRKDRPGTGDIPVDYVGFDVPDEFVVGYGLDFDNYYRNLPDIVTLKRDVIEGPRE
jgi:hypoxanthine phosphoribosyltransferase